MHPLYPFGCDQCHRMFTAEHALAEHTLAEHRATHVGPALAPPVESSAHFEDQIARGMERNRKRRKK